MSLVNAETGEVVADCTPEEARSLTERIRGAAEALWSLLAEAHDPSLRDDLDGDGFATWETGGRP